MRLLHEDELEFVQSLLEKKGQIIDLDTSDEQRSYLNEYRMPDFLQELENSGLIKIEAARVSYKGHIFMDAFLRKYYQLVCDGNVEGAQTLASPFGFSELIVKTQIEQQSLRETVALVDEILSTDRDLGETDFGRDLYDNLDVRLEVMENMSSYLEKYLEAFKNDELKKPDPPVLNEWPKRTLEHVQKPLAKRRSMMFDMAI